MVTHNPEEEKKLMEFPEGTPVKVGELVGMLTFEYYPENFEDVKTFMEKKVKENMFDDQAFNHAEDELVEHLLEKLYRNSERNVDSEKEVDSLFKRPKEERRLSLEEVQMYARYRNSYEFGIQFIQEKDVNVSPRNIGKPMIVAGTIAVCYEYPAEEYKLL